jgi:plastocyanin
MVAVAAVLIGGSGCASTHVTSSSVGSSPPPPGSVVRVSIESEGFVPRTVNITVGQTVMWTNDATVTYNVAGTGLVSGEIPPGKSFSHQFKAPGTYNYLCTLRPSQAGLVIVAPK